MFISMDFHTRILGAVILVSAFTFVRSLFRHARARVLLQNLPGPPPSSRVWGEEWELYHLPPGSLYSAWHKQHGRVIKYSGAFGRQIISVTDPRAISFILVQQAYNFPKARGVRAWFNATVGKGILWVEGKEAHEKQRRLVAPPLSVQSIRSFVPMLFEASSKLAAHFSHTLDQRVEEEVEVEFTNWAGRFALDAVCRAVFEYDFDCLSGRPDCLSKALDDLTNSEHCASSFYMRALFWVFPSILLIGKKGKLIRETKRHLGEISLTIWKDAKLAGDISGRSLMAHLLKTAESGHAKVSEEELVSQMRTIISAGYEPVSSTLAWILYEISIDQSLQTELREEISALGENTMESINSLSLLNAVIKETLRLHPPIIENHHEAGRTMTVPLSDPIPGTLDTHLFIPEGTLLSIPLNVIHQDPDIWGSDAHHFRPSRWLHGDANRTHGFLSFSEGPRSCLGQTFAKLELKIVVITLVSQFRFRCEVDIEEFQSFVIRPRVVGKTTSSLPLLVGRI